MGKRISPCLAAALVALAARPGAAQERPPGTEAVPPPATAAPPAAPAPALPAPAPDTHCGTNRVLWMERQVPVQTLVPREIITEERTPTLEVAYREENRTVTEMVVRSRDVERQVPCTVMKPVTETCPETGECTTVWKPCTEIRTVREPEYYSVPETRTVVVRVPYLRPAELVVPRKTVAFEYRTAMQIREEPVVIPGPEIPPTRWVMPPEPPHEECPMTPPHQSLIPPTVARPGP
jgi:hypothetical protein